MIENEKNNLIYKNWFFFLEERKGSMYITGQCGKCQEINKQGYFWQNNSNLKLVCKCGETSYEFITKK